MEPSLLVQHRCGGRSSRGASCGPRPTSSLGSQRQGFALSPRGLGGAASVLFVIAGGVVFARWARRGRSRAQLILAITICTVAWAGVVIGVVLASQATAICACDAL
jgi:hypothetical protein